MPYVVCPHDKLCFQVGWVKADTKAIQAIHKHVITHNTRVSVSHSDHNTWMLHIKNVQEEDRGPYMCQINTDPMRSQVSSLCHIPDLKILISNWSFFQRINIVLLMTLPT